MKLRDLLADVDLDPRDAGIEVGGVTADSRTVKPGDVFVAIAGNRTDGARFVASAIAAGAMAIVVDAAPGAPVAPAGPGRRGEIATRGLAAAVRPWPGGCSRSGARLGGSG